MDRTEKAPVTVLTLAACGVLLAVPFFAVHFSPIADLPQHLAQIRLFGEALADPDGPYRIQWLTPYLLAYLPLSLAWLITPHETAGRTAMLILALSWVAAVHGLAAARGRPASAAVLASVPFFNHATYWGFYSFVLGWPAFVLWFLLTTRPLRERFRPGDALLYLATAWLLYLSHALWFAVGIAWWLLRSALARPPLRIAALQLASISPVLIMAVVWYRQLSGFSSPASWFVTPSGRLSFSWLVDATLGGLRGPAEYGMVGLLAAWVGLAVYRHRDRLGVAIDRDLGLAAAFFFGLALLLPDKYQNTIMFATRWQPMAVVMLLLCLPAPAWTPRVRTAVALTALALFVAVTGLAWVEVEREEYAGLAESLKALPEGTRLIGLDYVKTSAVIKGRPFLQTFAYAQVVKGGQLNFSFAEFAPMAVVYRTPRARPWTGGLEWYPERATRADLAHFDYALVNAEAGQHLSIAAAGLTPVTAHGRWRLYWIQTSPR